uniref:Conserved oligomeric Golgi complex subunit 1 n=1 Tax=Trichuris muris TaxID=70415 RepID=A0A5S6QW47_TRIMR
MSSSVVSDHSDRESVSLSKMELHPTTAFSDDLFVKYSVDQVREIEKKIRHSTELKREELRLMVGRRYRDIIEAANDLHSMHVIAEDALRQLQALRVSVSRLQQYPTVPKPSIPLVAELRSNILALFLADLCDMLSTLFAQPNWGTLGWLFSLAVHVDAALIECQDQVADTVRIIWRDVFASRSKLVLKCEQSFSPRLDADEVCQMLCSLVLLEEQPLERLSSIFYSWSLKIFKDALLCSDALFSEQISLCITTWFRTIMLAHDVFQTDVNSVSLLLRNLRSFHSCKPAEIVKYLAAQKRAYRQCLEELISSFCPVDLVSPSEASMLEALHRDTASFLTESLGAYSEDVGKMLRSIDDLKSLVDRRESIRNALACGISNPHWPKVCEQLFGSDKERIMAIFYTPISQRAEQVVKSTVSRVFEVASRFDDIPSEMDCLQATWAARNDDSEIRIAQRLLALPIEALKKCQFVDGEYKEMLDALSAFSAADESFCQRLQEPMVAATVAAVDDFAERCRNWNVDAEMNVMTAVHCAKFCQGLLTCCENFKAAFFVRSRHASAWQKVTTTLNQLTELKYSEWILAVTTEVGSEAKANLQKYSDIRMQMEGLLNYESVTIDDDQGTNSSSKLLVPCRLSRWAFDLLHRMSCLAAAVGVHSMPRSLVKRFSLLVVTNIVEAIDLLLAKEEKLNQLVAVQLLLDLQVLTMLLLDEQSTMIKKRCRQTISALKGQVDAFDLELMTPRLKTNVTQQTLRLFTLFDGITADSKWTTRQLNGVKYIPDEQSQLLMLNTQRCRFVKLPICDDWKMNVAGNKEGEVNDRHFH